MGLIYHAPVSSSAIAAVPAKQVAATKLPNINRFIKPFSMLFSHTAKNGASALYQREKLGI
jgi:hypothetical protein